MGGDGTPTYSTISKDPGLEDLYAGESDSRNTNPSSHVAVVANIRDVGESSGVGAESWRGLSIHGGVLSPGSLPLQERPRKHRKYYKVSEGIVFDHVLSAKSVSPLNEHKWWSYPYGFRFRTGRYDIT